MEKAERQKYKIETGTNLRDILQPYQQDKRYELVAMTKSGNTYECVFRFILIPDDMEKPMQTKPMIEP